MTPTPGNPRTRRRARWLGAAGAALLTLALPACKLPTLMGADRGAPVPDSFNGVTSATSSGRLVWQEFFEDPALNSLIGQALTGNQELKILTQEVRKANLETFSRSGQYLPFVTLGADAGFQKHSEYTLNGAVEDGLLANGQPFPKPLPNFLVAADVSWEIDIWRKLRNARDAAAYRYLGTQDGQNYVVTRLVADVADNYYELLSLDNRLLTLDRTIAIQEQSLEVAKAKKVAGEGTELAVRRFEAEVRKNQSQKLIIQQQIVEAENRINFLCGRFPQRVERPSVEFLELNLRALNVGLPSELLQNRADIRQAERELAAAGLDVRVARARFYPSLILTAGVGYEAFNTKYLFNTPESLIYGAAGELVGPLINRRAIKADYLTANAAQLQAVYEYQRTIIEAYTEVINQITKVRNFSDSIQLKRQQLAALEASVDSASKLFQNAQADYVDVLFSQRDMMEARLTLIETKQQQLVAIIDAYQALGGGVYGAPGVLPEVEPNAGARALPATNGPFVPSEVVPVPLPPTPGEGMGPAGGDAPADAEELPEDARAPRAGSSMALASTETAAPLTADDPTSADKPSRRWYSFLRR